MASYVCVNGAVTPKIFIGGLAWETGAESAREYFSKWGTVVDVILPKNRDTGRSRGFGFITPDQGGDTLFAHGNSLLDGTALREGARVQFRPEYDATRGKTRAVDVRAPFGPTRFFFSPS